MRYVIVSVVNGDAGDFNNNLRRELYKRFNAKSSKLPAHFTIKAPFEYDGNITDLEDTIKSTIKDKKAINYSIDGYDHFDNRVIFMKVNMSKEGKEFHDNLIENMSKIPYIEFSKSDGKDKIFHVTLASKRITPIYNKLWNYVNKYECNFKCSFDNISIFKWEDNTWKLFKEFKLN